MKRLAVQERLLRIRAGDWRIFNEVREQTVLVLVMRIAPRGGV